MGSYGKIGKCTPEEQIGKLLYSTLDFPLAGGGVYRVPLSDQVLHTNLPDLDLAQVCKDAGNKGYHLSPQALLTLKSKLDLSRTGLALPSQADQKFTAKIQWLVEHPVPDLETDIPNTNRYIVTSIRLSPIEATIFRHAIGDSLSPKHSFLRRVPNPAYGLGSDQAPAQYAISVEVDATQYDQALFHFSRFLAGDDVKPETQVRVGVLQKEIGGLKEAHLKKSAPEKPMIIPDSYLGAPKGVGPARRKIAELENDPPQPLAYGIELEDYVFFRHSLFISEIALLRWKMGDKDNSLFKGYNSHASKDPRTPQIFFIKRDIDWDKLTRDLAALEVACRSEQMDDAISNRAGSLVKEADRLDKLVKEDDDLYQAWRTLKHVGWPFAVGGASLGGGYGVVKWGISKINGGPKGPSSPGGGGPQLYDWAGRPIRPDYKLERRGIRWGEGAKAFGWALATVGSGVLTATTGLAAFESGVATVLLASATPGLPDEAATAGLTLFLGKGAAQSTALTVASATAFYISGRQFLRSIGE